nr:MAG TPA: hypothetical protein [Caudoviricetes sp.]
MNTKKKNFLDSKIKHKKKKKGSQEIILGDGGKL